MSRILPPWLLPWCLPPLFCLHHSNWPLCFYHYNRVTTQQSNPIKMYDTSCPTSTHRTPAVPHLTQRKAKLLLEPAHPRGPSLSISAPTCPVSYSLSLTQLKEHWLSQVEEVTLLVASLHFLFLGHFCLDTKMVYPLTSFKSFLKWHVFTEAFLEHTSCDLPPIHSYSFP